MAAAAVVIFLLLQILSHALAQTNDRPVFDVDQLDVEIFENYNTSLPILSSNYEAYDPEGDPITYSIPVNGLGTDKFYLVNYNNTFNIFFKPNVVIDREAVDEYSVVVEADDGLDHGDVDPHSIIIVVEILDINDEAPVITNLPATVTYNEDTDLTTILYNVDVTDKDIGKNGQIRFSIDSVVPSWGMEKFGIYVSSGQIFLKQYLDYENTTAFVITVRAQDRGDQPLSTIDELTVQVMDVNDQDPKFDQTQYYAQISESYEIDDFVLQVYAFDQDLIIDDEIIYSIDNNSPGASLFRINSTTGAVYVDDQLDVDSPGAAQNYTITIIGEESMDSTKLTTTTALIIVLDINDNPPLFEENAYNGTISESSNVGTTVITVTAMDLDQGANAKFTFKLENLLSTPLPFNVTQSLDGESGHIQLAKELDYETDQMYKFEVIATEIVENKTQTALTIVTVFVTNINDNFPVFGETEYFANISEIAAIGDLVGKVTAEDDDLGMFGTVYYYLINHFDVFEINPTNGIITLKETIDYELVQSYALTVAANDSAMPVSEQLKAQVQVHVQVLDANDNGPIISVNGSQAITEVEKKLEEAQEAGVLVFVIDADDIDDPPNDEFDYFIEVLEPKNFFGTHFKFSETASNQIVTAAPLDYENIQQYKLRAWVTDVGSLLNTPAGSGSGLGSGIGMNNGYNSFKDLPTDHLDYIDLIIKVIDENDNNPVFVGGVDSYVFDVYEEQPNNTFVGISNATDIDSGDFGTVRYFLSGVDHENFTIDAVTGDITTSGPIDRESKDRFDLIVTAEDLGTIPLSATASVTINILDINDNIPMFSQPIYVENDIFENTLSISIQVSASDLDINNNSDLMYSIVAGNTDDQFEIDSITGVITRNPSVTLDREVNPEFELIIQVKDNGMKPLSSNGTVFIELQDKNDNRPLFDDTNYELNITESTLIGTQILTVEADDIDSGPNGIVQYTILATGPDYQLFAIEQSSGIITTNKDFDYDTEKHSYSFTIKAQDNGVSPQSSVATVTIEILDINDNSPIFTKVQYSKSMLENVAGGTSIITVKANDKDSGDNKRITYSVTNVTIPGSINPSNNQANDTNGLFTIDNNSGELYLSVNRSFDYESVTSYTVLVEARDNGVSPNSDSSVVQVNILDFNDNSPVLSADSYSLDISEDTDVPTFYNIFSYDDADSGSNAVVTYAIDNMNEFTIDPNTGTLTLVSALNYEDSSYIEFNVTITNFGLTDDATVSVFVVDVNDNDPVFQKPSSPYTVNINLYEGNYTKANMLLYTFSALDADDLMNGEIEYTITNGDTTLFTIDTDNGEFNVTGVIDRETEENYELTITAADKGNPSRSASSTVFITILDINESPPSFLAQSYANTISENNVIGMSLATVQAEDPDYGINGSFVFSINDTVNFNISNDGVITANKVFNYEDMTSHLALVTATDGGSLSTTVSFTLTITDKNDNKPNFLNTYNTPFEVPENAIVGFYLASAEATDLDSGANGDVTYQMAGTEGKFSINSTGHIMLQSSLDRENNDYYTLVVTATDHGISQMSSVIKINVTVTDVNDQKPVFEPTFYDIEVPENESISTTLISVSASDNDIMKNGQLSLTINSGNIDSTFSIQTVYDSVDDSYTGHIVLNKALNYETETSYSLQILAADMGNIPKTSIAFVSIKISNVNDEVPVFSPSNSYSFSVSEIAVYGTPVGTVYATDGDTGVFGEISSYSFPQGTSNDVITNFDLSSSTGVLSLANTSNLDYDNGNKSYTFLIVATDGGGQSSTASIVINVLGHNEDSPFFPQASYTANVTENLPMGQTLITVVANDPDNSPVTYSIIEGNDNDNFEIDSSGNILTKKPLDRESKEVYVLRIEASDGGPNPLSGYTQVEITVLDENDNYPTFPGPTVEYKVSETALKDLILTPVISASDDDSGENSKITYTAQGDGVPNIFSVNLTNGEIKLNGTINYEDNNLFIFTIFAKDNGPVPKTSNLTVMINVLDFNDNDPQFENNLYTKMISESIGQGSLVLTVYANDSDSGSNAMISYSIDGSNKFEINSIGEILTKEELDYETDTMYTLTVTATDNGTPKKSATASVVLSILDANDNTPVFDQSSYSYDIDEQDVSTDVFLLSVAAIDNDGTTDNSNVTYNITNGNDDMTFRIDENGNLFVVQDLDYEMEQLYILTVEAKDNPIDPLDTNYNTTQVYINLNDINDNVPEWKDNIYRVTPNQFAGAIREDAAADTLVLFIEATDMDSNSFGTVTYSFLTPSDKFYVNETSGYVYTHGNLDSEVVDFYNLTLVARDGGLMSTIGYLSIEVIDVNDRQPSFISSFFYEEVSEAEDQDFLLVTLSAFDIDSDDLVYSIISGNALSFFKINSTSGEVSLAKMLDRETEDDFLLTVFVSDGEFNDTTNLRVVVNDINDNAPQFVDAPYFAFIKENTVSGAVLLYYMNFKNDNTTRVLAVDADKPDTINSIVVYEMIGPNKDVLNIAPSKGVITVASVANLDYEDNQIVVVDVLAQDSAKPPGALSSTTTITIYVEDVNDNNPVFITSSYAASVTENNAIGTTVQVSIEADDIDTGVGGVVTYDIVNSVPSTSLDDFIIDNSTGEVTLAAALNREETQEIVLTVRATDGGPSTFLIDEVTLTITVLDENDNTPIFNQSSYITSVSEDIGQNAFVITVLASDEDDNDYGDVRYSLLNFKDVFHINEDTGVISTETDLDHETDIQYSILVQACDKDIGNSLCSNVTVTVLVTDVNDLSPVFDYTVYYTTLCDDATPVTNVLQVIAMDGDSGDYGKVTYSLASGSSLGTYFTLNEENGQINLINDLPMNYNGSKLVVNIVATDGGNPAKTGETEVQILFCDRNTTLIYFNQSLYYGAIEENQSPPISVTTVSAVSSNTPITYTILPPVGPNHFIISDGMINATMMLDREEREIYTLIVKATDSAVPSNTAYSTILVAILDLNDNPPMFLATPYSFSLTEELTGVTVVSKVVSVDPDQPFDPNGVTYSLDSASNPNGVFSIDANGTIYANKPVDRETDPLYQLKIKASDKDPSDPRITTATATITILDINDNSPVFDPANYSTSVSENHPASYMITKVSAKDSDIDLNKEIIYSIVSGDNGQFFIDSSTGVIKTVSQLDYEDTMSYTINVKAEDKGTYPQTQSSFTTVIVAVEDYNDCTPMFTKSLYETTLDEDFALGQIFDIDATDCDSGVNKDITFTIVSGNNDGKFELNSTTGELSLKNSLDFEDETTYLLQITATDGGTPTLSNLTQVVIGVNDVNDEDPVFQQMHYDVNNLPEDRSVGFEILVVTATDGDHSPINSALEYSFVSGNANGDFVINPDTGSIKIEKPLDRENISSYNIIIQATDKGVQPRSASATLTITITDVNDNPPVITNLPPGKTLDILENAMVNEILYKVVSTDMDINQNALLYYSLQNYEDIFSINAGTGEISLRVLLDYDDSDREYQLSIEVSDLAFDIDTRLTDHATLNIQVQDINDNDPIFVQKQYTVSRPEEESAGQEFVTVEATDNDGTTLYNKITYNITDCSPNNCLSKFSIDPDTGVITNMEPLNREDNDHYVLSVEGVNIVGVYPYRSDMTTVTITITDINDHTPQFTQHMYSANIPEGVPSNTPLFTANATDGDQPNTVNSDLSYKIVSIISNNPFSLNEDTGLLEVTGNIDRESVSFYNFTIRVEDNGESKLYQDVPVEITVDDRNDQPPVFTSKTQGVKVSEGIEASSLPYLLWSPSYTDSDELTDNKHSLYSIVSVANGTTILGADSSLVSINKTLGAVWLTSGVDFEVTKNLTVVISVRNSKNGTGELCGGFDIACGLADTATLNIEVTDINDNVPMFDVTSYSGQISTSADPGTQIRQVYATDKDTQNDFGKVRYRLTEGSSTKFRVQEETGWVVSRGTFENDNGRTFTIGIEVYDNLGQSPSQVSSVQMTVLALSDFRRVLVLFDRQVALFTESKEQLIIDTLHNLTGYTIVVEEIREHLLDEVGDVDTTKTDFIFHAINANGEIVDFDILIENLNVEAFFSAIADCQPIKITSLQPDESYPKVETIMLYLITLCGIIILGAIIVLVFACQQRYIALNSMWKSQMRDAFYGANDPSLIEGAMTRDFSGETFEMRGRTTTKSPLYVEPYENFGAIDSSAMGGSSIGDIDSLKQGNPLYEERELRMDMFELSDDETDGDLDDENLLAEALKDDDSDSGSVTAI